MAFTKKGYGQVEPNHLSAMRTHQIYAQLPANASITQLENGQFAKYDYANKEVNFTGEGEWMLVLNEVKLYGKNGYGESYKDFVFKADDFTDGKMYPRLYKTNIGDIMTTNCVKGYTDKATHPYLVVDTDGMLKGASAKGSGMAWAVIEDTTCPDAITDAVKIQRIQ